MKHLLASSAMLASIAAFASAPVHADWGGWVAQQWEQHVKPPAQQAAKAATSTAKAAIAPAAEGINVITGKKTLAQAATDAMQAQGAAISDQARAGASVYNNTNGAVADTTRDFTNLAGGNGSSTAAGVSALQAPSSIVINGAAAGIAGVGQVMAHGGDLSYVASAALAAALSDAHARLQAQARPIPDNIKKKLILVHSPETLTRARYVVATIPDNLASMLDRGQTFGGAEGFAVTIDDIIVFSRMPGISAADLHWWAHEVQHTVQYRQMGGIESFANAYMKNAPEIERDAEAKGIAISNELARLASTR